MNKLFKYIIQKGSFNMSLSPTKADFLINLVGTSAMPNLIALASRINSKGKIYFIYTEETKPIAEKLEEFIKKKNLEGKGALDIESQGLEIFDYDNPEKVYENLKKRFSQIKSEINDSNHESPLIELNYTGATKVISSIAYGVFKDAFKEYNINFAYLDGEKSEIHIHGKEGEKDNIFKYCSKESYISLNIMEVVEVHGDIGDVFEREGKSQEQSQFSKDMLKLIVSNIEKREEIINYLEILNSKLKESNLYKDKDNFINFINDFLKENPLLPQYKNYEDFIIATGFDPRELPQSKSKLRKFIERITKEVTGNWFEAVIHNELKILKDNGNIDDFVSNLEKVRDEKPDFEIDFIAMKDYKMYYFSVTTCETVEKTEFKLYEIKQRAKILSETESAIAAISFGDNKKVIIDEYKNIWQEKPKNIILVTWDDLPKLSKCLQQWIENRGIWQWE